MIPPELTVPSGAVVELHTKEASDGQITESATVDDLANIDFGLIHALTGPIYVVRRGSGVSSANGPAVADRPGGGSRGVDPRLPSGGIRGPLSGRE